MLALLVGVLVFIAARASGPSCFPPTSEATYAASRILSLTGLLDRRFTSAEISASTGPNSYFMSNALRYGYDAEAASEAADVARLMLRAYADEGLKHDEFAELVEEAGRDGAEARDAREQLSDLNAC